MISILLIITLPFVAAFILIKMWGNVERRALARQESIIEDMRPRRESLEAERRALEEKEKAPPTRQIFRNNKDELAYLRDQITYWLDEADDPAPAMQFADRFETLVHLSADSLDGSIVLADYRATLADLRNDTEGSIEHRKREIELVETLLETGGPVGFYDWEYVALSYKVVSALSEEAGKVAEAEAAQAKADEIERTRY